MPIHQTTMSTGRTRTQSSQSLSCGTILFSKKGIEVSQVELELPAVPHTCKYVEVDPQFSIEFDYSSVEVVYICDPQGVLIPMATAYCLIKSVNGFKRNRFVKCLFDTGASTSMAHRSILPLQAHIKPAPITTMCNTCYIILVTH